MVTSPRRLAAVLAICCVAACSIHAGPVFAGIVLGNLGSSGTNAVDSISANAIGINGANNTRVAMAFTTGTSPSLSVSMIQLGLGSPTLAPDPRIRITTDSGGNPSGTLVGDLFPTATITSNGLYNFVPASSLVLNGNTKYWFSVFDANAGVNGSSFNWYDNQEGDFPAEQNGSGYGYPSPNATKASTNGGTSWSTFNAGRTASFNLLADSGAVPEIDSAGMGSVLALLTGAFGLLERSRAVRKRR